MKRLLVHLHIFYHNQTDYFIRKLSYISGCDWDLYVTMSEYNAQTERKILDFKPDARIMTGENYGYDVWPFIRVVKSVNLDGYDYILKLHTKNTGTDKYRPINMTRVNGLMWRNGLVNALLKSNRHFKKLLDKLNHRADIGLICNDLFYIGTADELPEDTVMLDAELARLGLIPSEKRLFCAGTMFLARASLYDFLQSDKITGPMFEGKSKTGTKGSQAHVYERILSMIALIKGYKVSTVVTDWANVLLVRRNPFFLCYKYLIQPVLEGIFSIKWKDGKKYLIILGVKTELHDVQCRES